MTRMSELLEVGWISKVHGLRGDILIKPISNVKERFTPGSRVVAKNASGERDLVIVSAKPYNDRILIHFEGIDTREQAESLRGSALLGESLPDGDEEELYVHEIIGAQVFDSDGNSRGVVTAVQANPASDLLVLDSGHLVPLVFVVEFENANRRIVVDTPQGLFDL